MVVRRNNKKTLINYENSIKKSNELSIAKLNHGLTLNQMQLLAFAIYCTQQNGVTEFHKADFEKKFDLEQYRTDRAKEDAQKLTRLQFSIEDLENDYFEYLNVFQRIKYDSGLFTFKWSEDMVPHILEIKDKYVLTDLSVTSKFRSGFSWSLYDFLKAHYGYWHKPMTKEELMNLFCVENVKSYQDNTGLFKTKVLDVAIEELKKHTEFDVWYKEIKKGRAIIGFDIYWTNGEKVDSATSSQITEIQAILDVVFEDMFKYINLRNDKNRERAIEIIKELENYRQHVFEPISITSDFADVLLKNANVYLKELENFLEQDKKPEFYNWLDERE